MKRRTFLQTGAVPFMGACLSPAVLADNCIFPAGLPKLGPKQPPRWPLIRPSSGAHVHKHRDRGYLVFVPTELNHIVENGNVPLVIASGFPHTDVPPMPGWKMEHLFDEDIVVWVKRDDEIDNITCNELQRRIRKQDRVFFNTEDVKYSPISNWMNYLGFDLPDAKHLYFEGLGGLGYLDLYERAYESENPLVIGMRGARIDGFRPISIDGLMPIESDSYPLRKPVFGFYKNEEEARIFWDDEILEQQYEELDADMKIYEMFGIEPQSIRWVK